MYAFFRRVFAAVLALVSFFVNLTVTPAKNVTPDDAIRIVYADTVWGDMKLFLPQQRDITQQTTDVLFAIHGGAWVSGTAKIFFEDCRAAAKAGYIAVSMNYDKIVNGAKAADMVAAVDRALTVLKADLETRGAKIGKLILAGHSAGAHIMLLYAYTHYATCPIDIAFLVSNCAPSDFLAEAKGGKSMVGLAAYPLLSGLTGEVVVPSTVSRSADAIRAVTAIAQITPDVPPTIIVQGTNDKLISYQSSVDLFAALQENGVDSVHITYEGAGHFLGDAFPEANEARSKAFYDFAAKYGTMT